MEQLIIHVRWYFGYFDEDTDGNPCNISIYELDEENNEN